MATQTSMQIKILAQLAEVIIKVDESVQLGRENGNEIKMLRRELGLDGQHGRLPIVEATLTRHESRMDRIDARVDQLEKTGDQQDGRARLVSAALSFLGGSAGAALIYLIAHLMGIHW
jgi:hypothetical protein